MKKKIVYTTSPKVTQILVEKNILTDETLYYLDAYAVAEYHNTKKDCLFNVLSFRNVTSTLQKSARPLKYKHFSYEWITPEDLGEFKLMLANDPE